MDMNFSFIDVFNPTENPIHISHHTHMGTLLDGAYSTAYEVDVFVADTFLDELTKDHHHKDVTLTIDPSSTECILPNDVHVYTADSTHTDTLEAMVQHFPIWDETEGFVNVPEDQWIEIPLVPGWESMVPHNRVYKQGPTEQQIIDNCFNNLHSLGCMSWAKGYTPSGYPIFVVYWYIHNPDGTTITKEYIVIDLCGVNKILEPDIYPLPTQDEILQLLQGKCFISVVNTQHMFH